MPNTKILKENGQEFYPVTHASLIVGMENQGRMDATYAWDGTGTPDITKIPAGVVVTYDGTSYTGTLAASADTAGRFYLVPSTTVTGEYDRYLTDATGSTITWKPAGTTAIPTPSILDNVTSTDTDKALSANQGKLLKDDLSQLEAKVDSLPRGKDYGFFTSSSLLPSGATEEGFAYVGATEPYSIWQFNGTEWTDSGVTANAFAASDEQVQDSVDEYLEEHPVIQGTFSNSAKWSLLHLLEKVAYIDEHGREYLNDLYNKLFLVPIDRIEAVFTQGSDIIYDIYTLDSLKQYLVVTIYYTDGTSAIVDEYTLSGTLESGLSTITVTYVEPITTTSFIDTFEVTVTGTTKLYYYGDECSAITGGWQNKGFNLTAGTPTAQKTSDHLLVRFATSRSNQPASKTFSTINPVDLTGKTKLLVSLKAYNAGGNGTFWVYWPTTLAESTTQAEAFGSDYSSNRGNILPLGSPYIANPEYDGMRTLTPLGTSRTSAYVSLNLNLYDAYTAGAYVEIYAVAIV